MRLARPAVARRREPASGLDAIVADERLVRVGALVRQAALERSELVRRGCRSLAEALPHVGHFVTRNRGTVGGSIAHADAAAELPLVPRRARGRGRSRAAAGARDRSRPTSSSSPTSRRRSSPTSCSSRRSGRRPAEARASRSRSSRCGAATTRSRWPAASCASRAAASREARRRASAPSVDRARAAARARRLAELSAGRSSRATVGAARRARLAARLAARVGPALPAAPRRGCWSTRAVLRAWRAPRDARSRRDRRSSVDGQRAPLPRGRSSRGCCSRTSSATRSG